MIKGYEDGGPPTLCQPASQQGGGEEDNILAGGAWRGLEVCWGFGLKILCMLSSNESGGVFWEATGVSSWRGAFIKLDDILLIMAGGKEFLEREWGGDEILCKKVKVLFIQIVLLVVFYCQCLIRSGRRKYSRIKLRK